MESVNVSRVGLILKIEGNRAKHIRQFDSALVGWRKKLVASLSKALRHARAGRDPKIPHLPKPQRFVDEYDRVLGMLRMSKQAEVTLTSADFDCFVRDKWDWSAAFANSTIGYARGAAGGMKKARRR
jgi:hypothetical protein